MEKNQINLNILGKMIDDLAEQGWSCADDLVSTELSMALARECQDLATAGLLGKAAIGRGSEKSIHAEIRGDFIFWLEPSQKTPPASQSPSQKQFIRLLEQIQGALNESLYLGLKRFETHFALYPPQAGYERHVDNPRGAGERRITFILYLNENWQQHHGGELSLFAPQSDSVVIKRIEPTLGRFVLFRSEVFPHQVEKSFAPRMSLTGWFRNDALS